MKTPVLTLSLLFATAAWAWAGEASAGASADPASTIAAPAAAPSATAPTPGNPVLTSPGTATPGPAASETVRLRNITPEFAAALARNLNIDLSTAAAQPAPTATPAPGASDAPAEDENNANVIRLNPQQVIGERPPVFRERDLYSRQEIRNLALRRFSGLNLLPGRYLAFLNNLNRPIAEQMYLEDERLSNINRLNRTANAFQNAGAAGDASTLRTNTTETYRRSAPAWQNPNSSSSTWTRDVK